MWKYFFIILVTYSIFGSNTFCNSSDKYYRYKISEGEVDTIPFPTDSGYFKKGTAYISEKLNLRNYNAHQDSFHIRFWLFPSFSSPKVIDLNLSDDPPAALGYSVLEPGKYKTTKVYPKSGWNSFAETMGKLEFGEKVSCEIEFVGNDGETIVVDLVRNRKQYFIVTNLELLKHQEYWESGLLQVLVSEFYMIWDL